MPAKKYKIKIETTEELENKILEKEIKKLPKVIKKTNELGKKVIFVKVHDSFDSLVWLDKLLIKFFKKHEWTTFGLYWIVENRVGFELKKLFNEILKYTDNTKKEKLKMYPKTNKIVEDINNKLISEIYENFDKKAFGKILLAWLKTTSDPIVLIPMIDNKYSNDNVKLIKDFYKNNITINIGTEIEEYKIEKMIKESLLKLKEKE